MLMKLEANLQHSKINKFEEELPIFQPPCIHVDFATGKKTPFKIETPPFLLIMGYSEACLLLTSKDVTKGG